MGKIIGIDVYTAVHSPRGMGIYTINFLKELSKIDNETKYILYADIDDSDNVLPKQDNFEFKILPSRGLFHYEQIILPKQCKKDKIDVLHSPANTSPVFLDRNIKRIVTIHDIIFLKREIPLPKNKKQLLGRLYYAITTFLNIKKVDMIFTVSNYSKKDIAKTFNINLDKIIITPNGHEHFNVDEATDFKTLKRKYNIPNKYFFHLGGDAPSKNTEFLLSYFKKNNNRNIVVAGIKDFSNSFLYSEYNKYSNIYFIPYISQRDLVGLYKNAKAFLFSSLYEGFGIPLLESMKCNCPIICANTTCLPEVAGNAALYFNPKDMKQFIEKLNYFVGMQCENNLEYQLKHFSWIRTAEIIKKEYYAINL